MNFGAAVANLVTRPRLILLIVGMLCLAGLGSLSGMARQEDPAFPDRAGLITVLYPGATAEVMERLVLEPLQDEISQVEEVQEFTATARTGVALVNVELLDNMYDTDTGWERVRIAMDRAEVEFPDGVTEMTLDDRLIGLPAVVLAMAGDSSIVELSLGAEQLKRDLMDLPGLSRIELEGDTEEQINIAFHDAELVRLGLTPGQLANYIVQRNQVSPGGFLVVNDRRLNLLSNNEFTDLEAIRDTQIPLPSGGSVPLAAVASVWRSATEPPEPSTFQDGEQVVSISLYTIKNEVDAIQFGEIVRDRLSELRPNYLPLEIRELFFQPDQVSDRLDNLMGSLMLSMLIITGILFLGMGWRMGVLVAGVLPVVTLISLGIYDFGGGVLHQIAVIGAVISLGILIDNAIVMVENIQHRLNEGATRKQAMLGAIGELAGPLGASTGTTLAAFTPLLLSAGGTADFTRGIPVMIMLTLAVSFLLAVTLAPLVSSWFLKPAELKSSAWIDSLGRSAAKLSRRFPIAVMLAGVLLAGGSMALFPYLNFQFFPNADRPQVVVEMFLPEGSDIRETHLLSQELEQAIRQQPNVTTVHRFVGFTGPGFYYNLPNATQSPNRSRLVVNMESLPDTAPFMNWIRDYTENNYPEFDIIASTLAQGPPRSAPVEIRVFNSDNQSRLAAAEQVFSLLKGVPGAVDVRHDIDTGVPVLRLNVDDASAQRYGLSRADVAQTLFARSFGLPVEEFRQELDPLPIVLRSNEGTQLQVESLLSSYLFNTQGQAIPLSLIAQTEADWQVASINHRNRVRVLTVTSGLADGYSFSQVLDELNSRLAAEPLPVGTRLEFGGDLESSGEANNAILATAPIGILLLLFFLLLQFNSYKRVGIILLTVPLAAAGIFPGLVLTDSPFGFQPLLGIIALVGIVVNNAIVLVDRMDQRLREGIEIDDAVDEAVRRRTRPILLTTATTVTGLLPLAFSSSTLWPPMAWAIISGLLASTVLTLLVIPAVCRKTLEPKLEDLEQTQLRLVKA
ncbi:MAG: efflux RND transporter permease subunit [Pseudomonadales bacterium]|nr:efflux RND transporter permease subunit [Pseudomonadales bacterium]